MKVTPLAQCLNCHEDVPAVDSVVKKQMPHPQGIMVVFECPSCQMVQHILMLPEELKRRAAERRHSNQELERRREIGRTVKGFAVDLEAVVTIDDMKIFWDYQERNKPESIVIEDEVIAHGEEGS